MSTALIFDEVEQIVSPAHEMAAYEAMWLEDGATFKRIADKFRASYGALPSDLIPPAKIEGARSQLRAHFQRHTDLHFGVRLNGLNEYPQKLRDAKHPIELLYYSGWWDLVNSRTVAVVGARKASDEGRRRARKLAIQLVKDDFTVVSGLAEGVDHAAHTGAIEAGGRTIAVIGTPLTSVYPKANAGLQKDIMERFLVISQVPFLRYNHQSETQNRLFFPERNITMSALAEATVIVEASDTSGTLYQARAALHQGRKLFILESCFHDPCITWPKYYESKGAIRVSTYEEIKQVLNS